VRTLLTYVFALLAVGGLLFLAASFAFGRDEEMAPALPEGTPVELPDDRPATGADLRALRLAVVLRGYRMEEVDWVLDRLAEQIDSRDREIARLRSVLHVEPLPAPAGTAGPAGDDERLVAPDDPIPARAAAPDRAGPADRAAAPDRAGVPERAGAPERVEAVRNDAPVRVDPPLRDRRTGSAPDRDRRTGPGPDPVRGLRPDTLPDRDQR
jgi:DivIVA domain-containing protein